jgi:hyperosmotically inducible protein
MQNRKMLSRFLAAALVAMASAATVHAAGPADRPAGSAGASDPATTSSGAPSGQSGAAGAYVDDAMITTKVKAALIADKQVSALKINVKTEQGVVKMSGTVPSAEIGQRALELAAGVEGVKNVQNDLRVKG